MSDPDYPPGAVAIVGMAGRFPGASDLETFWQNLRSGTESITFFSDAELLAAGVDPALLSRPDYVKARSLIEGADLFDATFFGYTPREAAHMDPQHRLFLECAWEALERAGYDSEQYAGAIGVYAGISLGSYFLANLVEGRRFIDRFLNFEQAGDFQTFLGNDKDYLTSRLAYRLNLRGPAVTVQTACSTSLVAVCQACQSLLSYQCDMALAGGVSVNFPERKGYLYTEGGMMSPDGHCRAFDAKAQGTVFGNGLGIVVLKRLEEALQDGDHIHAVIRGSALNNDGEVKVSYTAPSIDGQAEVITLAQALAGVRAESIGYVETHGTGTPLGDPIEFAALTKAFRETSDANGFCGIGSLKTNIGHLDVASGIAGLTKAVLALEHEEIPPTLHFEQPNPQLDLASSPFRVISKLQPWPRSETPRRAGVSSFGVGGTNAHVVLEEAPEQEPRARSPRTPLFVLSAKTPGALAQSAKNLALHLRGHADQNLEDVAYTLQVGRRTFAHRRFVAARTAEEAAAKLEERGAGTLQERRKVPVIFLFPGQGAQSLRMGEGLYTTEPVFRQAVDECAAMLAATLGCDLRTVLYPEPSHTEHAAAKLRETRFTQPALFVVSYALARLWMSWGIQPAGMLGHSVGEYVAACLAGVFALPDALALVAERARIVQEQPPGSMLAVRLSAEAVTPWLGNGIDLAAVNSPNLCVVSGPTEAISSVEERLSAEKVPCKLLATSHAFHSAMLDGAVPIFTEQVRRTPIGQAEIPFVSCTTGKWLDHEQIKSPEYWAMHLRETVQFAPALATMLESYPDAIYLEVGPGQTLYQAARPQMTSKSAATLISSIPGTDDAMSIAQALGKAWQAGAPIDWSGYYAREKRRRVILPTYPFERQRHWVEAPRIASDKSRSTAGESAPEPAELARAEVKNANFGSVHGLTDGLLSDPTDSEREEVLERVKGILFQLSGVLVDQDAQHATFVELGFDSLFLTQARQAFQREFAVKVTFRQLLEEVNTPAALARFVESRTPAHRQAIGVPRKTDGLSHNGNGSSRPDSAPRMPATAPLNGEASPARGRFGPYHPADRNHDRSFTPEQEASLASFTARFNAKTRRSKELAQQYRKTLADPRAVSGFRRAWKELVYQIVVDRSAGSRLWDVDGNEYIDITMGFGVNLFGHSPQFVTDALSAQLKRGTHIGPQCSLAGEVAAKACTLTGMDRVTFCNTGSEAVMAAMRVARTVTSRRKIVFFTGDYHGTFDEVLQRANKSVATGGAVPIAPGIPFESGANIIVLDYGAPESLDVIREAGSDIAAVLVEPVQSRCPGLVPIEFLRELRQLTREIGALLIFDEVITGFRVHPGGCQALIGIEADLATFGKVVGGGIPIGMIGGRGTFLDAIDGGNWRYGDESAPDADMTFFAGTFVRHPLALAAADVVLKHLVDSGPELQQRLNDRTAGFVRDLNELFETEGVPFELCSFSSFFRFAGAASADLLSLFCYHLLDQGVYIREPGQNCFLSTAHTEADLARIRGAFARAIGALREGGYLSPGDGRLERRLPRNGARDPRLLPLIAAQQEIWLACQFSENASRAYNESLTLRFTGPANYESLRNALLQVWNRHEALRMTFTPDGAGQKLNDTLELPVSFCDWSGYPAEERRELLNEFSRSAVLELFDLTTGPLVRAKVAKLSPNEHVLTLTAHHLVCDGWSIDLLVEEIAMLASNVDAVLAPAAKYSDYIRRELKNAGSDDDKSTVEFWLKELEPLPPAVRLPCDLPAPAQRSYQGKRQELMIAGAELDAVRRLAQSERSTLFTTLFAAFQALVFRLSGQDTFLVGVPFAGQPLAEMKQLVGHCVHLLPLKAQMRGDVTFRQHLARARQTVFAAQEHGEFTFSRLLPLLKTAREGNRSSLVSLVFNVAKGPRNLQAGQNHTQITHNPRASYQFDLGFNISDEGEKLRIECDYSTDLFSPALATEILTCFRELLICAAAEPDTTLDTLRLLGPAERDRIVRRWNDTAREFPGASDVATLFEAQASGRPAAIAISSEGGDISYAELKARAENVSAFLQARSFPPGTPVGIWAERSPALVAAILGIVKAGCVYVPLDPTYPAERLAFMISDTGMPLILASADGAPKANTISAPVQIIDELPSSKSGDRTPVAVANGDSPAYILYTSGTTGEPKGVIVPHRGITRLVCNSDYVKFRADEVVALASNPCFDAITFELWGALLNGGRLVITPTDVLLSPGALADHLRRYEITTLFLTTSLFNQLAQQSPGMFAQLRNLVFGGEAADAASVRRVLEHGKPANLVNGYGPTETTTFAVCHSIESIQGSRVPIGRPIANTQVFLLDAKGEPAPVAVPGELMIGGPGVALGYLNSPELSAARFIQSPFGRLYKTGDRARWLPDGTIEYLGRNDQQIKLRGFRIEAGEIESAVYRISGIERCAVAIRELAAGDRRMVVYYSGAEAPAPETVQRLLEEKLPSHAVPSACIAVERFPLTSNGKLAVDELPLPQAHLLKTKEFVGPRNALDAQLIEIWETVFKHRPIGIRDDFFSLGGHSLLAAQMLAEVEARFGKRPPFAALFERATIEHLADVLLATQQRSAVEHPIVPIRSTGTKRPFFFLHGDYVGGGFFSQTLAQQIGEDRPFFAVHPHGLAGGRPLSIEAMAAERLADIRKIQPHGPYLLGGYCNGALTAFEMARLLESEGEKVDALVLLTADGSNYRLRHLEFLSNIIGGVFSQGAPERRERFLRWHHRAGLGMALAKFYASTTREFFRDSWANRRQRLAHMIRRIDARLKRRSDHAGCVNHKAHTETTLSGAFHDAVLGFVPRPYSGHVTLLWPTDEHPAANADPEYGWKDVCGSVDLILVPGNHHSCISQTRNLEAIGNSIREVLQRGEEEPSGKRGA